MLNYYHYCYYLYLKTAECNPPKILFTIHYSFKYHEIISENSTTSNLEVVGLFSRDLRWGYETTRSIIILHTILFSI